MKPKLLFALLLFIGYQTLMAQNADESSDFYEVDSIQEINIIFEQDNWRHDLDSLRYNGDGLSLAGVEINGQKFDNVGVRYRQSKSFTPGSKRNGLHIRLNYINKDQNIQGHNIIKLSRALRDPSMIREVLSYEIARAYMPAPRANYARVKINGELYGLFVNVEAVSDSFLDRHFGSHDNAFFAVNQYAGDNTPEGCKSKIFGSLEYEESVSCFLNNFEMWSENGWDDLIELTQTLNESPGQIANVLNVDRTLWMLAFNNVLVNLSSYSGQHSVNYYLYKDESGQFNPVIWDLNLSFGSFKNTGVGSDLRLKTLQELDPLLHADNVRKPLINRLLESELYKKTYLSHIRTIVNDYFSNGKYEKRARVLQDLIRDDFSKDPGQDYSSSDFETSLAKTVGRRSKIPGIMELMEKRAAFLSKHRALTVFPPDISEVNVMGRPQFSATPVQTFRVTAKVDRFPKRVKLLYRLDGEEGFKEAIMYDDGKHNDGEAEDGIYGATIVPQSGEQNMDYYIFAENATMVGYNPTNYMWKVHSTTLETLNK